MAGVTLHNIISMEGIQLPSIQLDWERIVAAWPQIFGFLFMTVLARTAYLVIYRIWFHPLSRFPGPTVAKLTDLWTVWYSIKGESHLKAYECHQKYGPIVRFGPNKLSITSINGVQETYNSDVIQKSKVFETICPTPGAFSTFTAIDKGMHRRKRKVISKAFSDSAMRAFEPTIRYHADVFVKQIGSGLPSRPEQVWSEPMNMTPRSRYFATDVMGEFGFGKSFDVQTSEANRFLIKATDGASFVAGMYCQYPKLKHYGLGRIVAVAGMATKEKFGRLAKNLIDQRLAEAHDHKADLLHFCSDSGLSDNEIWAESRFTLIAGAETTGTAISATLFYLARNADSYARLVSEIRTKFATSNDINASALGTECKYLWACVDEAMRLSPSVVAVLWREVAGENFQIDGEHIPKGSDVGVSVYCPHHDKQVFPDPFSYWPERWLDTGAPGETERIALQRRAFNPFGLGARKCIGYRMAYTEIAICLAKTLWALDMRLPEGELGRVGGGRAGATNGRDKEGELQLYEHITTKHDGPYLQWAWREDWR